MAIFDLLEKNDKKLFIWQTNKETKCQNAGKYQERLRDSLAYCYAKRTCGNPLMYSAIFRALISKQKSHHEVIKIHHFYTFDEFSVQ